MGQEIVYCFKCQIRIVGTEFDKGAAFQLGNNVCCSKCAAELLQTLPPKEREQLLAQMFKATHERRLSGSTTSLPAMDAPLSSSSAKMRAQPDPSASASARAKLAPAQGAPGAVERRKSSDTARRRWAQRSTQNMTFGALGAVVIAVVAAMMLKSGGSRASSPLPLPIAGGPTPAPVETTRGPASEHDDIRKARDFARANPKDLEGQIAAWRNARLSAERSSDSDLVQKELERLGALQSEAIRASLAEVDAQSKPYLENEEFVLAASLLRAARPRFAAPEWTLAVDRKIEAARESAVKLLPAIKEKASDAKKRGAADELRSLQARVQRWGHPDLLREFEAVLADVPEKPAPPPTPVPAVSKALEAYRRRWDTALGRAVQGDAPGASQDISAALEGVKDEGVRAEAADDVEALRRIGLAMQEIRDGVARTPKGQRASLERWNATGVPEKIDGTVVGTEPGRLLIRADAGIIPVEIGELTPGVISDLWATRAAKKTGDERTAAFLGALAGDLERVARLKVELPERWRRFASKARAVVNAGNEAEARRLYAEAEDAAADPTRVATAVSNVKALLGDFGTTAFVARNRIYLNSRSNLGKEYLFVPDMFRGAGSFRLGKAGKMESAWLSEKDSDPAAAAQNFVELSFTALPDAEYRLWVYAGACCLETFAFWVQGTDLNLPAARGTVAEPGSAVVIPVRPTPMLKKTHAMHLGPKNPARWEWVSIPLAKYPTPGVKVVRLLTDQQGFAVAYASVSALTPSPPRESEIKELLSRRLSERVPEREVPGLVAYWPLDEGSGTKISESKGSLPPGTLQGPVTWVSGRFGKALRFDGGNSWVDLPNTPALDVLMDGSYTIMAWFQPDDLPPGKDSENSSGYGIIQRSGVHSGITYGNSGAFGMMQRLLKAADPADRYTPTAGTRIFPPGIFYHVAGILDRGTGTMSLVINGRVEGTDKFIPASKAFDYGRTPWRLGIAAPNDTAWRWCAKGIIDEVRFYNRALSLAEIETASKQGAAAPAPRPAPSDTRPWRPIFDGQTTNFIVSAARNDWQVTDGCLANKPGIDNAAQTCEEFGDGELRIRLESRGNSACWFNLRQNGPNGFRLDLQQLGDQMNQKEHEILFTMRGPMLTATIDGKPAKVELLAPSSKGMLQFNCSTDGSLRIRSIEYRP
jgi:hypothetical protein